MNACQNPIRITKKPHNCLLAKQFELYAVKPSLCDPPLPLFLQSSSTPGKRLGRSTESHQSHLHIRKPAQAELIQPQSRSVNPLPAGLFLGSHAVFHSFTRISFLNVSLLYLALSYGVNSLSDTRSHNFDPIPECREHHVYRRLLRFTWYRVCACLRGRGAGW
jgi:hypothetical protein